MEIYTLEMQEIINKRVNSFYDMTGHTVSGAYDFTNSDGNQHVCIKFEDGYWMLFEPVRSGNADIEIEVIDEDRFGYYDLYLLKKFGICSEEVHYAEHIEQTKAREADQIQMKFEIARKFLQEHPEYKEKLFS